MTDEIRAELIAIASKAAGSSQANLIDFLVDVGVVTNSRLRMYVVGSEFFRLMSEKNKRTASDIEHELSVRYDITKRRVQQIRVEFSSMRHQPDRGRTKMK